MNCELTKRLLLIFFMQIVPHLLFAQAGGDDQVRELVESLVAEKEDVGDYSGLLERLAFLQRHPLDLNKLDKAGLEQLMLLSPLQISALLEHRTKYGRFLDVLELQTVRGMDMETVRRLTPFVKVYPPAPLAGVSVGNLAKEGKNDLTIRLSEVVERQAGYVKADSAGGSGYLGAPLHIFARYKYELKDKLKLGLTVEKDPGEALQLNKVYDAFDFYSGYVYVKSLKPLENIVVGDYSLQFGQGLAMWTGYSFGKGPAITAAVRNSSGARPYSSVNEVMFMRGIAATLRVRRIRIYPFISYKPVDGVLAGDSLPDDTPAIQSVSADGYHRTASELQHKHSVMQAVGGSGLEYETAGFKAGAIASFTNFDCSILPVDKPYNRFNFSGTTLSNFSFYGSGGWKNFFFFGEAALSAPGGQAYVIGALGSLSKQLSLLVLRRSFQPDYHSFFSQPFSEAGGSANENGSYAGLTLSPGSKVQLTAYCDFFSFPWLKFSADAPSRGHELFAQLTLTPCKDLEFKLRYRHEQKQENEDADATLRVLTEVAKDDLRGQLKYKVSANLLLRTWLELVQYQKYWRDREVGGLIYQDLVYKSKGSRCSTSLRFALFDTQGYNSRIYVYENDLYYSLSMGQLQNRGVRFSLNSGFKLRRGLEISAGYSVTKYLGQDEVGSGLDLITGRSKSQVSAQIRFQFQ